MLLLDVDNRRREPLYFPLLMPSASGATPSIGTPRSLARFSSRNEIAEDAESVLVGLELRNDHVVILTGLGVHADSPCLIGGPLTAATGPIFIDDAQHLCDPIAWV